MAIQAVILAGGLGTRARSIDSTVPKPMIKVAGIPFLYHMIQMLKRRGLHEMLFLLAYKSESVIQFLDEVRAAEQISISYSVESSPLGTAGALYHARGMLASDFVVINGDSYLDMNYMEFADKFKASGLDAMMTIYDNKEKTDVINNVCIDKNGFLLEYSKKQSDSQFSYVDAGVLAMKRNVVVELIPPDRICSLESEIYPKLIAAKRFGSYFTEQRFYDIGTPARFHEFEKLMMK
jgi:NDP-sugar pyrophosphorylase family protein